MAKLTVKNATDTAVSLGAAAAGLGVSVMVDKQLSGMSKPIDGRLRTVAKTFVSIAGAVMTKGVSQQFFVGMGAHSAAQLINSFAPGTVPGISGVGNYQNLMPRRYALPQATAAGQRVAMQETNVLHGAGSPAVGKAGGVHGVGKKTTKPKA